MRGKKLIVFGFTEGFSRLQRVVDSAFNSANLWTIAGTGIGTSAIAAGVLTLATTTTTYTIVPVYTEPELEAGTYSVVYTISSYVSGGVGIAASASPSLSSPTDGTSRTGNGTFTESLILAAEGFIGLRGRSGTVSSMVIDNFTVTRTA